jgi:hypothetical protein
MSCMQYTAKIGEGVRSLEIGRPWHGGLSRNDAVEEVGVA